MATKKKTAKKSTKSTTFNLQTLEKTLEKYFGKQAPALPKGAKKFIVDFGPWFLAVIAVVTLPGMISSLGIASYFHSYYRAWHYSSWGLASTLISLVAYGFSLAALPGLFKKTIKGWRLLFYASLINVLGEVISTDLVSFVLAAVVSWYLLFQIKGSYK